MENGKLGLSNAMELYGKLKKEEQKTGQKVSEEKKEELLDKLDGLSTREAQKLLDSEFSQNQPPVRKKNLSLDEETFKNLERLKLKLGLQTEEDLINLLLREKEKSLAEKATKKMKPAAQVSQFSPQGQVKNRHIPKKTRDEVRNKANYQCEFISPLTGQRCESKHNLQIDHIQPFAHGGTHDIGNLRLVCQGHNQRSAILSFGQAKMDLYLNKNFAEVGRPNQTGPKRLKA